LKRHNYKIYSKYKNIAEVLSALYFFYLNREIDKNKGGALAPPFCLWQAIELLKVKKNLIVTNIFY
jgi:hypothetical protein